MTDRGPDEPEGIGLAHPSHATNPLDGLSGDDVEQRERQRRRRATRRRDRSEPLDAAFGERPRASRVGAEWRRLRRLVALGLVLVVAAVTLGSALRDDSGPTIDLAARGPEPASQLVPSPPPQPLKLASRGAVILYVPIAAARITAIGYHRVDGSNALDLAPSGKLLNAGIIDKIERQIVGVAAPKPTYYISDSSTRSVDVGAGAGTQVYAPVNGTIVGITPNVLNGKAWGALITIQPQADPTVVVVLSHIFPADTLRVGQPVSATQRPTLMGTVADLSKVLKMDLARYTADAGNHLHIELRPTAVLPIP